MNLVEIFEKVSLKSPIEQRRFLNYYNDTVDELKALYSPFVFEVADIEDEGAANLNDKITVRELYKAAIADNILYLSGCGSEYRQQFAERAYNAWLEYWTKNAKGARIRRKRW